MLAIDDSSLMAGVARLDPLSLSEVHDRYYPVILRFILSKVGHRETAEDMTSDVFVRLLQAVQDCRGPDKSLQGWLFCVASNVVNDYFRRQYARGTQVEFVDRVASDGPNPIEQVINNEMMAHLQEAIGELTNDQQVVIQLRYGLQMTIRETAMEMGKSEGAVKQLQARAVAALAYQLAPIN